MPKDWWRPCLAEAVGTFFLVFIGIGAILADVGGAGIGLLGIALAHGLALAVGITATGHISGGHLNPAVTSAFMAVGKMELQTGLSYIGAQCAGALVAAALCAGIYAGVKDPKNTDKTIVQSAKLGTPVPGDLPDGTGKFSARSVFFAELVLTFLLMTAVFGTAVDERAPKIGGFGIGLTVAFDILMGGPVSGAAMNPARVFGPAVVGGVWDMHLLYWLAPICGAVLAAFLYTTFFQAQPAAEPTKSGKKS